MPIDLRQLKWPDTWLDYDLSEIPQDTTGDSLDNDLELVLNEVNYLVLAITGREYTQMLSALVVGADFSYSELSHGVVWPLLKAAKMATFCDTVAACILSSTNVQIALENVLSNGGQNAGVGNPDNELADAVLQDNWLDGLACDNDKLWGACEQVVDGVFEATTEVLERINLAASPIDQVAEMLDAIPIVGGLLSFGVGMISWTADYAYDLWIAADSSVVREAVACELFCLAQDTCELTMELVFDALTNLAESAPPIGTDYVTQINWLIGLDITSSPAIVAASTISLLGAVTIKFGGKFGNTFIGIRSVAQLAALGAVDYPNSGWSVLCTSCANCTEVGSLFSPLAPGRGTYVVDEWRSGYFLDGGNNYRGVDIVFTPIAGTYLNTPILRVNYTLVKGTSPNITQYVMSYGATVLEAKLFSLMTDGTFEVAYDTSDNDLNEEFRILIRSSQNVNDGNVIINSVRFCDV